MWLFMPWIAEKFQNLDKSVKYYRREPSNIKESWIETYISTCARRLHGTVITRLVQVGRV